MINNPFTPKTGGVFTITELDSGGKYDYGFPSNASAGEFVYSEYYLGRNPSPNIRTESGKSVPYNEFGDTSEKNCEFVMPAENVVVG